METVNSMTLASSHFLISLLQNENQLHLYAKIMCLDSFDLWKRIPFISPSVYFCDEHYATKLLALVYQNRIILSRSWEWTLPFDTEKDAKTTSEVGCATPTLGGK